MSENGTGGLRSERLWNSGGMRALVHHSRLRQFGYDRADYEGKPFIAILDTGSDINPCHQHFGQRVEDVKRGVWQAGGFPIRLPVQTLAETFQKPSAMLYRNLLAMEAEEVLRSYPFDGAVLMGGCDKTTPGLVMGATSAGLPFVFLPAGPMLRGDALGRVLGSGTSVWQMWSEWRAGRAGEEQLRAVEEGVARSPGICMTMGTASTMTAVAEALGLALPGSSSIPAVDSRHAAMATRAGRRSVEIVRERLTPDLLITSDACDNAATVIAALGGSTNAVIHLIAIARRAGVQFTLDRFESIVSRVPALADIAPSGRYVMEDFFYAGGLRALMARLGSSMKGTALTVTGRTISEEIAGCEVFNDDVIRPLGNPVSAGGALAVLRGSLAPDGAVIKTTAASPELLRHTGRAVVFHNYHDLEQRIDDPDLDVDPDSVLVLQHAGPVGAPGMPEWGMLPLPAKLLRAGVRDMIRISDARMSGTSYGTCVLHVAPEAAVGGPLALVHDGDLITLDVAARRIDIEVPRDVLAARRAAWRPPPPHYGRGWGQLYVRSVTQANEGCDLEFLSAGPATPEPESH